MIIVWGNEGTGKSTVARLISDKNGFFILRTDMIRREMFKKATHSKEEDQLVYEEMFKRTKKTKSVILDATFRTSENREKIKEIADNDDLKIIEVVCDKSIAEQRISARKDDASEFRPEFNIRYNKVFEPIAEDHIIIKNNGTIEDLKDKINRIFI